VRLESSSPPATRFQFDLPRSWPRVSIGDRAHIACGLPDTRADPHLPAVREPDMSHKILLPLMLGVLCGWTFGEACAKGPKGGGKGRPAAKSTGNGFGRGRSPGKAGASLSGGKTAGGNGLKLTGRDNAFNVQRQNEERKLTHRQQTAQKLRDIAGRNGNDNLLQTADRMDQQALSHYEQRLAKIDELSNKGDVTGLKDLADSATDATELKSVQQEAQQIANGAALKQLDPTNLTDAARLPADQQLLNSERTLQHQLGVAQQLRDIAAQNGNSSLLQTAERMETMAADRYQAQLTKLGGLSETANTAVKAVTIP